MAKTLEQILGYVSLTGLVEDVKTGVPDLLPKALSTTTAPVIADAGVYTRYAGTRKTARRVEYGAGSLRRELSPIGSFPVKLNHVFEHILLDVKSYQALRNYTDYNVQRMGVAEVQRQALQFRTLIDNTRISMQCSMLTLGKIYFDVNGNLLPSSSGATVTVDFGVNANNQNQLNGIIAASWALPATDIPLHIRNLRKRARLLTGFPLKTALYGAAIPSYFAANTVVKEYLSRNPGMNQQFVDSGEVPNGLFGLDWQPMYEAFYEDSGGTNRSWWGDDVVTFIPEINSMVYELLEGTYPVPKNYQPVPTLESAMGDFELVTGMFSYAKPNDDPMTAKLWCGDTSLPVWKVPDALFCADVVP